MTAGDDLAPTRRPIMRRSMTRLPFVLPLALAPFSLAMGPCDDESLGLDISDGAVTLADDAGPTPTPGPGPGPVADGGVMPPDASSLGGRPDAGDGGPPPAIS